ncbi:hypothetical protein INS90_01120 [Trueperella pecoris]|uniref:DUF2716 domain-containing protein n=1 Tax=Trueperella pecoris TaxID=2733571 RepID=A0A7M1R366_9ACTO|nr:hypothetical protein [Trueperella pecoris]QOR47937.1 hypothetical protein INS90_01120 [Trueperella pecoris]
MKIAFHEADYFARFTQKGDCLTPIPFAYTVGVASPGAQWDLTRHPPFAREVPHHNPLSIEQERELDQILVETSCSLNLALYAGYFGEDWGHSLGFVDEDGTFIFGERFNFMLYRTDDMPPFAYYRQRWDSPFSQVVAAWPDSRSWFFNSLPDAPYTIIGSDNAHVVDKLLASPVLGAVILPAFGE